MLPHIVSVDEFGFANITFEFFGTMYQLMLSQVRCCDETIPTIGAPYFELNVIMCVAQIEVLNSKNSLECISIKMVFGVAINFIWIQSPTTTGQFLSILSIFTMFSSIVAMSFRWRPQWMLAESTLHIQFT